MRIIPMSLRLIVLASACGSIVALAVIHDLSGLALAAGAVIAWCYRILWTGGAREQ